MSTHTPVCSHRVYERRIWASHYCTKPVTVTRAGEAYCKIHDPEYIKAKYASKCWERVHGRLCGAPAAEASSSGFGRCAKHTEAATTAQRRLINAAPALLAALKDIAEIYHCESPGCMCIGGDDETCAGGIALAAIAQAKEREA